VTDTITDEETNERTADGRTDESVRPPAVRSFQTPSKRRTDSLSVRPSVRPSLRWSLKAYTYARETKCRIMTHLNNRQSVLLIAAIIMSVTRKYRLNGTNKQTRTIKVSEMTESLHMNYKSRSHGKDCLKR